jgi:hypothetical protein
MTCCQECGYNWDSPPGDAIATIRAFPAQLSRLLRIADAGNDDHRLRTRPNAKTWSPLEYIAHSGAAEVPRGFRTVILIGLGSPERKSVASI